MNDGSGPTSCEWCAKHSPCGCWRKTLSESLASNLTALHGLSVNFVSKATKHACTKLVPMMSERRTDESECGLSGSRATPVAQPSNGTPEDFLRRKRESVARGNSMGICLSDLNLQVQATAQGKDWHTPRAMDGRGKGRAGGKMASIETQVKAWPTPRASENENRTTKPAPSHGRGHGKVLAGEVHREMCNWPTPTVAEADKISCRPNYGQLALSNHPAIHGYEVDRERLNKSRNGQPDQERPSTNGKPRGSLNSTWVSQLMGYPPGWLDLPTSTLSELSATPSYRKSRK